MRATSATDRIDVTGRSSSSLVMPPVDFAGAAAAAPSHHRTTAALPPTDTPPPSDVRRSCGLCRLDQCCRTPQRMRPAGRHAARSSRDRSRTRSRGRRAAWWSCSPTLRGGAGRRGRCGQTSPSSCFGWVWAGWPRRTLTPRASQKPPLPVLRFARTQAGASSRRYHACWECA